MPSSDNASSNHIYLHFTPVQIRFNDIDIMGHVNNSVFQHYFDYARLQYFRHVFGQPLKWDRETLILASISVDYQFPVHIDNQLEVASSTIMIGNKSLHMCQEVQDTGTSRTMASSRCVLVAFDALKNCTIPLPGEWKDKIISFEKEIRLKYG